MALHLTAGHAHDGRQFEPLYESLDPDNVLESATMDKGYDADRIRERLSYDGVEPVKPPLPTRARKLPYDYLRYRERNRIERFFNKIKHFRRIATRYGKLAKTFFAAVCIVSAFILIRNSRTEPRASLTNHFEKRTERPRFRGRSGEHTRPRVWCSTSRRTEFSGGPPGNCTRGRAGTRALPRRFGAANISEASYENRSKAILRERRCHALTFFRPRIVAVLLSPSGKISDFAIWRIPIVSGLSSKVRFTADTLLFRNA